jgi:hypothetical protein
MKIAIHTVFILRENILFLEEWVYYHILLGFNKFYLYDNSKVTKSGGAHPGHKCFVPGKVSKYGVNYDKVVDMTDVQIVQYIQKLCEKYKCIEILEWSPTDGKGNILHNQEQAHNHCLKKLKSDKIDWCANIDMDEYIVIKDSDNIGNYISSLPPTTKNIKLGAIRFDSRFNNRDKFVTDITGAEIIDVDRNHGNKNIYNVENTIETKVHGVHIKKGFLEYKPSTSEIWFNHYKLNRNNFKYVNNINEDIKTKLNKYSFLTLK